ncbi:type VI secretion system contractile sheath large subunit [Chitinispirillales bacterium ANBcel5]|uniref:type VI secretion system contractile sheath large subunit n=1 Tax=Cellulosispirillum alkaliphilum TaxID=3039283 RepID=UPI002A53288C|nr:type VI secretion system contractile sheath large subunit [Chitinispirillales bacterium ANBcel5]
MAEETKEVNDNAAVDENSLDYIYQAMDLTVPEGTVDVMSFSEATALAESKTNERIGAALNFFIESVVQSGKTIEKIDKYVLDGIISDIDEKISDQLDEVMHHEEFQKMESAWRSLKFLVDRTDFRKNVKIDLLDMGKDELVEDFEDAAEVIQSGLYKQVYTDEYDTPGGEPYGVMISNYEFNSGPEDVGFLQNISKVAAACHCPFVGSATPKFFGKDQIHDLTKIEDLHTFMDRSEFMRWNAFRKTEDSRYVGLTLPKFALRLPYGPDTIPVKEFNYTEKITGEDHNKYLWGNASFAFAANMVRSFIDNGWCVQIRGPESGGKVEDLPVHFFDVGKGTQMKIPTEILIPETREFEFANEGFIPLSFYKNRNYACFFSANSAQKPQEYDDPIVTANMRINSRLPYIFMVSRIAHYLKVIQRENIGTTKSRAVLQDELNNWIKGLVTEMPDPGPDLIASHPLKAAEVNVNEVPDNPGFFTVSLSVMPHFQIEGIDINLSLVSQMPKSK